LETGTRSEAPLPSVDAEPNPLDPAATQPTLEPTSVDAPLSNLAPPTF
jgi:hypothetical protein